MVMFWGSLFTVSSWMVTLQWSCQICINNAQIQKQGTVNVFFAMHSHAVIPSFAWKKFFPSALLKLISFSLLSLTKFITRNGSLEFKVLSMWIYILSLWKSGQMSLQLVLRENFFLSAMLVFIICQLLCCLILLSLWKRSLIIGHNMFQRRKENENVIN